MLCREARVALISFLIFSVLGIYYLTNASLYLSGQYNWKYLCLAFLSAFGLTFFVPHPDVSRRGAFIGTILGIGCAMAMSSSEWNSLGIYLIALAFFHLSEYILTALYNQETLTNDSFILNHSTEYHIAVFASLVEFCFELWLYPPIKTSRIAQFFSGLGMVLVLGGEICRKLAMITAKSNFSHNVQYKKVEGHQLVTSGIYKISRHPSYFGWFYWSIGTQMLLCNPLCTVMYAIASWMFFHERIEVEERYLIKFFGEDYINYMMEVPTRIPFNNGLEAEVKKVCNLE